jgi:ABC-type branched-subunit amino acid transport system substrate-binding protein
MSPSLVLQKLSLRSISILGSQGPYGRMVGRGFSEGFPRTGSTELNSPVYCAIENKALRAALKTVLAQEPNAIYLAVRTESLNFVLRGLYRLTQHPPKVICGPGLFVPYIKELPPDAEVYFPVGWHYSIDDPDSRNFVTAYKAKYGRHPHNELPVWGYSAVKVLNEAMIRAGGSWDSVLVGLALGETESVLPVGRVSFDGLGRTKLPLKLIRLKNGRFTQVR